MGTKHFCCLQKEMHFYLKELTNYGSDLDTRQTFSCKWSESITSRKTTALSAANKETPAFKQKSEFRKPIFINICLTVSQYQNFSDETDGDINKHDFRHCQVKCVHIWENPTIQWTGIFQMSNLSCDKKPCIGKGSIQNINLYIFIYEYEKFIIAVKLYGNYHLLRFDILANKNAYNHLKRLLK